MLEIKNFLKKKKNKKKKKKKKKKRKRNEEMKNINNHLKIIFYFGIIAFNFFFNL